MSPNDPLEDQSPAAPRLTPGGYQIETKLDQDWLGTRYRACAPARQRAVLVRLLAPRLAANPAASAALQAAPARLAGLTHPHIAPLLDAGRAEGHYFMVYAEEPGQSLAARLAASPPPWPLETVLPLVQQLASALDAIHAQGLVYGLLAPAHLWLTPDGRLLLYDLGLAWPADSSSGQLLAALPPELAVMAAPELLAGGAPSPATDRFAAAALAYLLFVGQWPFPAVRDSAALVRPRPAAPADPLALAPALGRDLAEVLLTGLSADPAQRYASAQAFGTALAGALAPSWQSLGLALVNIPTGPFTLGAAAQARIVHLPAFAMTVFPVTNAQFAAFIEATGYVTQAEREGWGMAFTGVRWTQTPGATWRAPHGADSRILDKAQHPVVQVSHADAQAFCAWAGLALPTEEQWEKAARGADGRRFPWGESWRPELCQHAGSPLRGAAAVDAFAGDASPFGVRGLAGNTWEWTVPAYAPASPYLVLRGGAWPHAEPYLTATFRYYALPGYRSDALSFRCVHSGQV